MKTKYTAKQIRESIKYWTAILEQRKAAEKQETKTDAAKQKRSKQACARLEQNRIEQKSNRKQIIAKINSIPELVPFNSVPGQPKMVVFGGRSIVLAKLGEIIVPIYCSTGIAGKSSKIAKAGNWFLFFGLGADGWFNKLILKPGSIDMNNQFACKKCQEITKKLNSLIGDIAGVFIGTKFDIKSEETYKLVRKDINQCFLYKPIKHGETNPSKIYNFLLNLLTVQIKTCNTQNTALNTALFVGNLGYKFDARQLVKIGMREDLIERYMVLRDYY